MNKYVSGKEASEILGVHQRTLMSWDKKGLIETIRTPGNKRLYNLEKYLQEIKCKEIECIDVDELNGDKLNNVMYVYPREIKKMIWKDKRN